MTFETKTFYAIKCDFPDCGKMDDEGEYLWWAEPEQAVEMVLNGDWREEYLSNKTLAKAAPRYFCPAHHDVTFWASDTDVNLEGDDFEYIVLPDGTGVRLEERTYI